jgi:hypothetical protein
MHFYRHRAACGVCQRNLARRLRFAARPGSRPTAEGHAAVSWCMHPTIPRWVARDGCGTTSAAGMRSGPTLARQTHHRATTKTPVWPFNSEVMGRPDDAGVRFRRRLLDRSSLGIKACGAMTTSRSDGFFPTSRGGQVARVGAPPCCRPRVPGRWPPKGRSGA